MSKSSASHRSKKEILAAALKRNMARRKQARAFGAASGENDGALAETAAAIPRDTLLQTGQ